MTLRRQLSKFIEGCRSFWVLIDDATYNSRIPTGHSAAKMKLDSILLLNILLRNDQISYKYLHCTHDISHFGIPWFRLTEYLERRFQVGGFPSLIILITMILYQVRVITVFTVFRLLTDFVCLYNYEFGLSLCKIVRSSVILLLPLL